MKMNIYAIFDTASGTYWKPIYARSDEEIKRSFKGAADNAESDIGAHPEDYSIFRLGTFDDNTAKIQIEDRECIETALEAVARSRQVTKETLLEAVE